MFLKANEERFLFNVQDSDIEFSLVKLSGVEEVSTVFSIEIELVSKQPDIQLNALIGKAAAVTLMDQTGDENEQTRYIHGIISAAHIGEEGVRQSSYQVTLVPKIWLLNHRLNSRIYQFATTRQIIDSLLVEQEYQADEYRFDLTRIYEPRDYCVQYRESDLNFIERLLEEEGIHYYFEHAEDKHMIVFSDSSMSSPYLSSDSEIPYFHHAQGAVSEQHIFRFQYAEAMRPGKVSLRDFNFKKPNLDLTEDDQHQQDSALEIYDYPSQFMDAERGEHLTNVRLEAANRKRQVVMAESDVNRCLPGYSFAVSDVDRDSLNGEYFIARVEHDCAQPQVLETGATTEGSRYTNKLKLIAMANPFRPKICADKVPFIQGAQTATVTGPVGEEIYTDEHGRVKVQFHWDREGGFNEHSSCWVRVSQNSAGGAFGSMFLPRIGEEVIVDFLEGNPDRPIITGRVYHGHNMPPYALPEHKTKSTIKTISSKGGDGFNEIRFEDKKGDEELFLHAEKDLDQRTLDTHKQWVGNEHHLLVEQNEYREFYNEEHALTKGNYHREVKQNYNHSIAPNHHTQIGKSGYQHAGSNSDWKGGQKILFEAGSEILIKAGGSTIKINPAGVSVNGAAVNLNGGGGGGGAASASPVAPQPPLEADLDQAGFVTEGKEAAEPWIPAPAFKFQDMVEEKSVLLSDTCTCYKDSCPIHGEGNKA